MHTFQIMFSHLCACYWIWDYQGRDGKTYERASNACVKFFIVSVKFVKKSLLF